MTKYHADVIEYENYDETKRLRCPVCDWVGSPKDCGSIEYYDDLFDVSCPICCRMLLIVTYPLLNPKS